MKKIVAVLLITGICIVSRAQGYVPSREDVEAFFKTKTLVVLEKSPLSEYNPIIRKVMEQEWNITEYDFITDKEFEEKRKNAGYSFIYMSHVMFEADKTDASYRFLHLSLGGNYFRLNEMPDIASIPLAYFNVEEERYAYKLGILVRFLQNHAKLIRERPEIISSNVLKHYNDNIRDIRGKTLYLLKEELSPAVNTEAKIRKVYPYKIKLVTMEDIEEAIRDRNPDVVFLHKVGPEGTKLDARSYKIIIGAADANFYYFDYHKISSKKPDGLLESDFKKLGKK